MSAQQLDGRVSAWGRPVIDFHCHFPVPEEFTPDADAAYAAANGAEKLAKLRDDWRWYQEQWWTAYGFPFPEDIEPPEDVQRTRWEAEIESAQLDAVVFVTGGGNAQLARIVAPSPRMVGFAHHDPFAPGAADELRRAVVDDGMRGYKLIAPALRGPIDHPDLRPVWAAAEELGIPVLVHFGPLDGGGGTAWHENISPLRLHDVAKAFTYVPFVIPHFGCGYPRELLHLAWACRNVHVDTSGNNEWIRWMPYELTVADLFRRFYETVGPERILFGSDSASFPRGLARKYYDTQFAAVAEVGIPDSDLSLIFHDNAARLLKLPTVGATSSAGEADGAR
ncbi:amidohydrolase family protein [Homoserinibacter sp. GY 40078]|uniref:amidohydrolase family protein n=1 Tax=Homoserinibacter sp. GY 40078 TaxID=2603275 RepID=UPI00164F493C|nr:amidohydrolase family protein [Homoserinibacter sp. GY 40078]